jgi:hypothetical protein
MLEALDEARRYGSFAMVIVGLLFIFGSGIFFGITYYIMDVTNTAFLANDCVINNNSLVSSCQELWSLAVYPFLDLKEILIWFSYVFIFALVLGMLMVGYQSGTSPLYLGAMVAFSGGITYLGIEISNIYRTMLENDAFRAMMVDFTVYNKIMLYFPWFAFFVGLFAVALGLVNFQRTFVNSDKEAMNY